MKRNENESYYSYMKRVTQALEDDIIDYNEWGDCLLGADNVYSSENLRKGYYIINKILPKLVDIEGLTENDILDMIDSERKELYKERVKTRDQRRELNKLLTNGARFDNLVDVMKESIQEMEPLRFNYKNYETCNIEGLEASLIISDIHFGIECDNRFNFYNMEVAEERLNELKNKAIHYCIKHNVIKLNVELLGDLVSGLLHTSVRVQQEEDVMTQLMQISEILANLINELQQYIPRIVVYSVFGNHSRAISNKKDSITSENFERLVPFYLRARLDKNIKVLDSGNDDFLEYKINSESIVLVHGDKDSPTNALDNMVRTLGIIPKQIHMAHRHHITTKDDCDTDIIANGSLVGSDDYALSVRKVTKPSQLLIIYDKDVCTYKLTLS